MCKFIYMQENLMREFYVNWATAIFWGCIQLFMLPWKLRKCQILPVNQNLSSDLANDTHSQTAKTVFSHLNGFRCVEAPIGQCGRASGLVTRKSKVLFLLRVIAFFPPSCLCHWSETSFSCSRWMVKPFVCCVRCLTREYCTKQRKERKGPIIVTIIEKGLAFDFKRWSWVINVCRTRCHRWASVWTVFPTKLEPQWSPLMKRPS